MKVYCSLVQWCLTTTWPFCVLLPTSLQPIDSVYWTRGEVWLDPCNVLELILEWSWLSFGCFLGVVMRVVKWKGIPECVVIWICYPFPKWVRQTQSVMYVPLQVNRFVESILLIVQYRNLKSCSGDFYSPESDSPHNIMRYWFYYSIWLGFSFQAHRICHIEKAFGRGRPLNILHDSRGGWATNLNVEDSLI